MWNENIEFYATLARPKAGVRFDAGNDFSIDVEDAVREVNDEWNGERVIEVISYDGISVKMAYRALDPIKNERTIIRYLQVVSQKLAHNKKWNERVTRKPGAIFNVQVVRPNSNDIEADIGSADVVENEPTTKELLQQILAVVKDIKEELRRR